MRQKYIEIRRRPFSTIWIWAVVALLGAVPVHAETSTQSLAAQCGNKTYVHRNIVVLGFPCPAKSDVSIVPSQQGAEKIIQALEVLYAQSPQSFAVIEQLKQAGPVIVMYDPAYPPPGVHLTTTQVAAFLPTFIEGFDKNNTGKQFTVIVGRDGIKWPLKELSAVLVHELMGHGKQHLEDRIDTMRTLDVECEAWLYEELAYQDLKIDKMSQEMIDFRQQLEGIHCDDFIRYMRKRTPEQAALWDVQNPDVAKLLKVFDGYIVEQRQKGMIASAQAATDRMRDEAIKKVARTGKPDDLYAVGLMYMSTIGQEADPKAAAGWFRKAAQQGHANAQVELATLLENGTGIEQNLPLAIKLYVKAAKQGNVHALYALGVLFETGNGVERNGRKARAFYAKAGPGFDTRPYATFGVLYRDGLGFRQDHKKAHELLHKAARLGNAWSQYALGELYDQGLGVKETPSLAVRWWWQAAQQGVPGAQNDLANHLLNGRGVKKDEKRAFKLFLQAAQQNLGAAQSNLARMYRLGLGTAKDDAAAVRWFRKAAKQGIASSQYELGRMYETGTGLKRDLTQAKTWYKKAAAQGYARAKMKLMLVKG